MIIDFHAHWWPSNEYVLRKDVWKTIIHGINQGNYRPRGIHTDDADLEKQFFDPDGSALLKRMETAGVDKTVILPLDWENIYGRPEKDIMAQNRAYAALSQKYPDKIIVFFSIHPGRENAAQLFKAAVKHEGIKGLKLYPPTGFYPDDRVCTPLYKICLSYDLPVLFHGMASSMSKKQYCHPDGFTKLAVKFPGLKIIIAHAGGPEWAEQAIEACQQHKNIYLDISGLQSATNKDSFITSIRYLFDSLGSFEKVLFGTDSPIFNGICETGEMVNRIHKSDVPQKELSNLLGNTGCRILKLKS